MNVTEVARRIAECLVEDGLPYAIGGALALGVWGAPRATVDVDVSVFVVDDELPRVLDAFERAGVMVDRDEAARNVARIGLFKGRLGRTVVDVFMSQHPQYAEMHRRSQLVRDSDGRELCFISAEDLCIHKLIYGRAKDVTDLERLIAAHPTMDLVYVRRWLEQMIPSGDRRFAVLEDLEHRFAATP